MATRRVRTDFDANTAQFDRGVQRMDRNMRRFQRGMETRLDRIDRRFRRSAHALGRVKTAIEGLVAIAGIRRLAGSIDRVISRLDSLANTADTLGIGVEALQELEFAAEQSGVQINNLRTGLQGFGRRAAEAAQGTGTAKDAFKELNVQLRDSSGRMRDLDELFTETLNRLAEMEAGNRRTALSFKLFESEGVAIVNMAGRVRELRQEARDLGVVLAEDVVRDAQRMRGELDRVFSAIGASAQRLGVFLGGIFLDLIGTEFRAIDQQIENIDARIRTLQSSGGALLNALEGGAQLLGFGIGEDVEPTADKQIAKLEEQRAALVRLRDAEEERASLLESRREGISFDGGGGGGGQAERVTAERANALQREIETLKQRTAELNRMAEAQARLNPEMENYETALRAAEIEARLITAAERGNVEVTADLAAKIREVALAYAKAEGAADGLRGGQNELNEGTRRFQETAGRVLGDFISDINSGISATEALGRALGRIVERLIEIKLQSNASGGSSDDIFSNIANAIVGAFSSGSAAPSSSPTPTPRPTAHQGGVIGHSAFPMRSVPDSIFDGAQRLHGGGIAGLRSNEVPAILEKGEIVVPKNIGMGRGGNSFTINEGDMNITEPGATPEQIRRIMAEERQKTLEQFIEMNEDDPEVLHT